MIRGFIQETRLRLPLLKPLLIVNIMMRNASIDVIRAVGVTTGGSNIQFAIDPKQGRMSLLR